MENTKPNTNPIERSNIDDQIYRLYPFGEVAVLRDMDEVAYVLQAMAHEGATVWVEPPRREGGFWRIGLD